MGMAAEGQRNVGVGQHFRTPMAGVVGEEDAETIGTRHGLRQIAAIDGAEPLPLTYRVVYPDDGQPLSHSLEWSVEYGETDDVVC